MGNCVFKEYNGVEVEEMIKIITTNGGVMELFAPITSECITNEFPGHGIYTSRDTLSQPLVPTEHLNAGQSYYLLPLTSTSKHFTTYNNVSYRTSFDYQKNNNNSNNDNKKTEKSRHKKRGQNPRHNSGDNTTSNSINYWMSFQQKNNNTNNNNKNNKSKKGHNQLMGEFPRHSNSKGVWKVKLVIRPEQLGEILGQEEATHELIESVRTVAKCGIKNSHNNSGNGFSCYNTAATSCAASTVADSDQWSSL